MHPTDKAARLAGAVYLSTLPYAVYFWSYLPGKFIVRGNATATAEMVFALWLLVKGAKVEPLPAATA